MYLISTPVALMLQGKRASYTESRRITTDKHSLSAVLRRQERDAFPEVASIIQFPTRNRPL
jgi:hypothetical protein